MYRFAGRHALVGGAMPMIKGEQASGFNPSFASMACVRVLLDVLGARDRSACVVGVCLRHKQSFAIGDATGPPNRKIVS